MIVFVTFLLLAALTVSPPYTRSRAGGRKPTDWALDGAGLVIQGVVVPAYSQW
jgi:hypothetical protein